MRWINSFLKWMFVAIIIVYQKIISPIFPATCRFTPTCSEYCKNAIVQKGIAKGFVLSIKRLSKCHPWSKKSGFDPVP